MQWRNTPERWGAIAQLLHWLIALAVFGLFTLGWVMVNYRLSPTKLELYSLHKSLGITVLALALVRIGWRLIDPAPVAAADGPAWERTAARLTHGLLYALLIGMPLSGYLINSASNFPLVIWGVLPLPNVTGENEHLQALAEATHLALFWLIASLVALHVLAAVRHHWILKDGIMRRMLPWRGRGECE